MFSWWSLRIAGEVDRRMPASDVAQEVPISHAADIWISTLSRWIAEVSKIYNQYRGNTILPELLYANSLQNLVSYVYG